MKSVQTGKELTPMALADAAAGTRQWLRMLAQAGVTWLPAAEGAAESDGEFAENLASAILGSPLPENSSHPAAHPASSPAAGPSGSAATSADHSASEATLRLALPGNGPPPGGPAATPFSAPLVTPPTSTPGLPMGSPASAVVPSLRGGKTPALSFSGEKLADGELLARLPDLADPERSRALQVLDQEVKSCVRCPELAATRTQTVFGVGNIRPQLVLMGEAPGADEDRLGEPMVGAAGQLLDKIINAMKLRRQDVYILNTVKCRPPQNRNPAEEECLNCRPFWQTQLEILKPDCVVCLGAVASKTLLQTNSPVGQLRGRFHDYRGIPVAVTYHPAYLLRTESAKRQTWEDMKMVMELLGIQK